MRTVLPDCDQADRHHDPPGRTPAFYLYEYQADGCPPGHCLILCVACCARVRLASQDPQPGSFAPPAASIRVLRDPNTGQPVEPVIAKPG